MIPKDFNGWTGRNFLFIATNHNVPGQMPKDIPKIRIEGTVTGVVIDEKTGATFVEISTRSVYIHNRVFPIVKQVITIEKGKKPYLHFDAQRTTGNECFTGEFVLIE
jgi:hypothetical protein